MFKTLASMCAGLLFSSCIVASETDVVDDESQNNSLVVAEHERMGNERVENATKEVSIVKSSIAPDLSASSILKTRINKLNGFHSVFTQRVFDSKKTEIQQSSGTLALLQPNQFSWQTLVPDESTLLSDGDTIWYYDPFIEQVTAYNFHDAVVSNPILLLLEVNNTIWQSYEVSQVDGKTFKVKVLDKKALIASIDIAFTSVDENDPSVESLTIYDRQGQTSIYALAEFVLTQEFVDTTFKFDLTDGIELDDQR